MARIPLTPPINTKGRYTVFEPYSVELNKVYRCTAIRTFDVLISKGIDVYAEYYAPKALDVEVYEEDYDVSASIVTLVSSEGEYLYIPNTFIESYPGMNGLDYNRKLLVIDMGLLPSTLDFSNLIPDVEDVITKVAGVSGTGEYVEVPHIHSITQDEHVQLEATRTSAIRSHQPLQERLSELEAINSEQATLIEELTQALADAQT